MTNPTRSENGYQIKVERTALGGYFVHDSAAIVRGLERAGWYVCAECGELHPPPKLAYRVESEFTERWSC